MGKPEKSIKSIWDRVLTGDSSAWHTLISRYARLVMSVARRHSYCEADAEDISQQTWTALYQSRNDIINPEKIYSWLVKVATRKGRRQYAKRMREIENNLLTDSLPPIKHPIDNLIDQERYVRLKSALELLDNRCRTILEAVFFEEKSKTYDQIAKDIGISTNSLGPTKLRCLKKLREILKEFEE